MFSHPSQVCGCTCLFLTAPERQPGPSEAAAWGPCVLSPISTLLLEQDDFYCSKSKGWPPPLEPHFSPIRTSSNHFGPLHDTSEYIQSLLWQVDSGWLPVAHPAALSPLLSRTGEKIGGKKLVGGDKDGRSPWPPGLKDGVGHPLREPSLAVREHSTTPNHLAEENRCQNFIHLGRGGKLRQTGGQMHRHSSASRATRAITDRLA